MDRSAYLHLIISRTLVGNWPSVPSSSCSVLLMTLWCVDMLKVFLRIDFLRFTLEYMSMFSWKTIYINAYIQVRSSGSGTVLFKLLFVYYSRATLTSSVSPVHMRRRSTSRFCLMLLMLSISWRTASAVLHTHREHDKLKAPLQKRNIGTQFMPHRDIWSKVSTLWFCTVTFLLLSYLYIKVWDLKRQSENRGTMLTFISNLRVFTSILIKQE